MADQTRKPKPLSQILQDIQQRLIERSQKATFSVVEDSAEWLVLKNDTTGELDISHHRSLTYSLVTLRSGPFTIAVHWTENDRRCYEPSWLQIHTEKVFSLIG